MCGLRRTRPEPLRNRIGARQNFGARGGGQCGDGVTARPTDSFLEKGSGPGTEKASGLGERTRHLNRVSGATRSNVQPSLGSHGAAGERRASRAKTGGARLRRALTFLEPRITRMNADKNSWPPKVAKRANI